MAELKTKKNEASVSGFINAIKNEQTRRDCLEILGMMKTATKTRPKMWGSSIVGFGEYHYRYASGREGDWFLTGFSPRKQSITVYIMGGLDAHKTALKKLGKHKTGVGCLYIKKLDDIDKKVLKDIIAAGVKGLKKK